MKNMGKPKPQTLKGFRDFLPEDALKRQWLLEKIKQVFELWGYDPIETPTLEPLELFEGKIGEEEKLFYKFEDAGGRKVALRYDQTVPASRVVAQYSQELPTPFKRYQIQPTFRSEKPQKGRYREFLQCDADIFGIDSPLADAEIIALALDIYKSIGFEKVKVLINDRSLFKGIPSEAIVAIDKISKIGEKAVLSDIQKRGIPKTKAKSYLAKVKALKANNRIKSIINYLENLGFSKDWFKFDPTLARGLDYYTSTIFEITIPGFDTGSVLGGGRYNNLIKQISGVDIAAVGFGLGFDRTLEAAEQFNLIPKLATTSKVMVTIFSPKQLENSLKILNLLRQSGINAELYPDENTKLEKQLKYADKKQIPWAVIIGPSEVLKNQVVLKNLKTKKQDTIPTQALLAQIE